MLFTQHNRTKTASTIPASQQMAQGATATSILENGTAPVKMLKEGGSGSVLKIKNRMVNDFGSPGEFKNFTRQVIKENELTI